MKILIVGLGAIGQRHLRNLRKLMGSDLEILAYRFRNKSIVLTDDLKIEKDVTLEEKYNIHSYSDLDQSLAQKPDIVFVCNPSSFHMPTALKAAQAGCHLFIEKPLSHNLDHVDELINLVENQKTKAVVGYQMRFNPCLQLLRSILQKEMIGQVLSVRAEVGEYLPGWHGYEDYRHTYAALQDQGGGAILSQIHELDYLFWMFGLPRSIYARGGHLSSLEIDVEDMVEILMECEQNEHLIPVSVHLDYLQRPGHRICELIGDHGKILVNLGTLTLDIYDGQGRQVEAASFAGFQRNQMFMDELNQFLLSLNGASASLVSLQEAAQSLRIAMAAKESLATGKVIEFPR
jgi:predicted dehydrogenase